jgi:hypothetical protein
MPGRWNALLAIPGRGPTRVVDVVIFPLEVKNTPRILNADIEDAYARWDAGRIKGALAC